MILSDESILNMPVNSGEKSKKNRNKQINDNPLDYGYESEDTSKEGDGEYHDIPVTFKVCHFFCQFRYGKMTVFHCMPPLCKKEQADQEEVDGKGDICKSNPGIGIGERSGEGDKTHQHQPYNIQPEEGMIDKPDIVKLLVMKHPDDSKGEK